MKIAILGFGREGKSILNFLKKLKRYRSAEFWIIDRKPTTKIPHSSRGQLGKNYLKNLSKFDTVFRSPGIPYNLPELKKARKSGVVFSSATKLFFDYCPIKNIIGVTGTKGKGTTSTLLYKILKTAGFDVYLAGNIGKSPIEILPKLKPSSWVILELSSFQLQDLEKSPHIAVVLDIFPDHQDSHLNIREYYEAKTSIARHQRQNDYLFFFAANKLSHWVADKSRGRKISVSEKGFSLFKPDELKIRGHHNFKNAIMAAAVSLKLGISKKVILKTVKNFRGLEHRLEFVRKIDGVSFYNDSASTNPQTTAAAIKAFPDEQKTLIAGGQDKGLNYKPLAQALRSSNTKLVILFGENKKKIARQIARGKAQIVLENNLASAIRTAYAFAKKPTANQLLRTAIVFSPGAASFDMFENYADRGRQFKKLVQNL